MKKLGFSAKFWLSVALVYAGCFLFFGILYTDHAEHARNGSFPDASLVKSSGSAPDGVQSMGSHVAGDLDFWPWFKAIVTPFNDGHLPFLVVCLMTVVLAAMAVHAFAGRIKALRSRG